MREGSKYLLIIGAHMALRERAITAAVRHYNGPVATMFPTPRGRNWKFFDHVIIGDPFSAEAALAAVQAFEAQTGLTPAAVVPFIDGGLVSGRAIADHYGLPFVAHEAIRCSGLNKDLMKDRFLEAGLPTPRYVRVADVADVHAAVKEIGLPCVIKPSAFGGSLGVRLIRTEDEAADAFAYVKEIIDRNSATFTVLNRNIQVEEFCDLTSEVSVEVLNYRDKRAVLAVVDKALGPAPFFAEMGHRVPSVYSDRADVLELALNCCAAIGQDYGLAHVEIRLERDRPPVIIEVGTRTAGDGILDQVERVYGIDPYGLHVQSHLHTLDWPPAISQPAGVGAIAMLKAEPGRIDDVTVPHHIPESVVSYEVFAVPGARSDRPANYLHREGYVECFWPGKSALEVPFTEHLRIADDLSRQLFTVADPG